MGMSLSGYRKWEPGRLQCFCVSSKESQKQCVGHWAEQILRSSSSLNGLGHFVKRAIWSWRELHTKAFCI